VIVATQRHVGKYEILEEIGRGGFAVVYRARDTTLDRVVALKVLHPQLTTDPKFVQRFHQEAQTAARLHHPHIVTIHEVGEEAGQHYLAMTFLPGRTLDKHLAEGPLPMEQATSVVEQIADALGAVHERGLVHRDVKPANVMVDNKGQATLLDFGIVRAAEGTRLTTTMAILGTPEYMAPEQADPTDAREIDWRADIYALGVVTYEMLVGQPPFTGKSPTKVLYQHVHEPPPEPCTINPNMPAGLQPVLLKALAKKREDRYQSAQAMARDLQMKVKAFPQKRDRAKGFHKAIVWIRGHRVASVLIVALVLLITLIVALGPWLWKAIVGPVFTADDTQVRPADKMVMVYVPAGGFPMGSLQGDDDERPVHNVILDAFWIDRTEVTNAQYALCVNDGWCEASSYADDTDYNGDGHPVVGVSWYNANAYCEWVGGRLPTEAEWEYAARGPEGHIYPWGDTFGGRRLNFCDANCVFTAHQDAAHDDGYEKTAPVGSYPGGASWCGALDMAGNVWEWVADWYDAEYYDHSPAKNPLGPSSGEGRGIRGGSWGQDANSARCANRNLDYPTETFDINGFRCVWRAR
jgi:formylglycine-generating enzyme required for sulfatase activity